MSYKIWITSTFFTFQVFAMKLSCAQSDAVTRELPQVTFDTTYLADYTNLLTTRVVSAL